MPTSKGQKTASKTVALTKEQKKIKALEKEVSRLTHNTFYQYETIQTLKKSIEILKSTSALQDKLIADGEKQIAEKNKEIKKLKTTVEFDPCSVCRDECPFKHITKLQRLICPTAADIKSKYNEAIKKLGGGVFVNGNRHQYSWLLKPVELPYEHEKWAIKLQSHLDSHAN